MRLHRLPILLCWLLCTIGAVVSTGVGCVKWLGTKPPSEVTFNSILKIASWLGKPKSLYLVRFAEINPHEEEVLLLRAIDEEPSNRQALLKLALIEEFRGNRVAAQQWIDRAMERNRSCKTYLAGLAQASRWKHLARIEKIAPLAFEYCAKQSDGVYAELGEVEQARKILKHQSSAGQIDYLRFLLGQKRVFEAFDFQADLPRTELTDRYRLELCEVLFWSGQRLKAERLFGIMHPEFTSQGLFNTSFRSRPTSLGFDWRLRQDSSVRTHWSPGELEVTVASHNQPLELVSLLIKPVRRKLYRALPVWRGETHGLSWQASDVGLNFQRFVLVAPPGAERRFVLHEVRFE